MPERHRVALAQAMAYVRCTMARRLAGLPPLTDVPPFLGGFGLALTRAMV